MRYLPVLVLLVGCGKVSSNPGADAGPGDGAPAVPGRFVWQQDLFGSFPDAVAVVGNQLYVGASMFSKLDLGTGIMVPAAGTDLLSDLQAIGLIATGTGPQQLVIGNFLITGTGGLATVQIGAAGTPFHTVITGTTLLTSGTALVSDTNVLSTAIFSFVGVGTGSAGNLTQGPIIAGTNFKILSTSASDGRVVKYQYSQ